MPGLIASSNFCFLLSEFPLILKRCWLPTNLYENNIELLVSSFHYAWEYREDLIILLKLRNPIKLTIIGRKYFIRYVVFLIIYHICLFVCIHACIWYRNVVISLGLIVNWRKIWFVGINQKNDVLCWKWPMLWWFEFYTLYNGGPIWWSWPMKFSTQQQVQSLWSEIATIAIKKMTLSSFFFFW